MIGWAPRPYRPVLVALAILGLLLPQACLSSPPQLAAPVAAQSADVYVSPSGNDANPGTQAQPLRTIQRAVNAVSAGGAVTIRGGTYHETVDVARSGTAGRPITISGYPGERPLIDGANSLPAGAEDGSPPLFRISGSYVTVSDLEIANSLGMGVLVTGSNNVVRNLHVHHCREDGIIVSGSGADNLVENSDVWSNCLSNVNGSRGRWGIGLGAVRHPTRTTLRGNRVYNNWGEGLSAFDADHTTIEGNTVYDNYAVNIYLDNAPYTVVQRNLIYSTDPAYYKAPGIGFCDEDYGHPATTHDVRIVNNLVLGGNRGFFFWLQRSEGGLKNAVIAHNTFANSDGQALLLILDCQHQNSRIENNIFLQEDTLPIAELCDSRELRFRNNVWSKAPPANAMGLGSIVANPQLARTGATGPGRLAADWFRLLARSPAIDRAVLISEVSTDYAGRARGSSPDCGGWEYQTFSRLTH